MSDPQSEAPTPQQIPMTGIPMNPLCAASFLAGLALATLAAAAEAGPLASRRGMVVSVSAEASEAGAAVMQQGGNAVDAAVATAFALAVTYPPAGNIGGGGFMMVLPAPGTTPICIEYRETAPARATATMFSMNESCLGAKAVGVPGTVRGLALAHQMYGRLPWQDVVQPAIRLAREGFLVGQPLADSFNKLLREEQSRSFAEMLRVYAPPDASEWRTANRLTQPDLADTLELIARRGPDGFYQGEVAAAIVAEMQGAGGLITLGDLAGYSAKVRQCIHGTFRGYDVYGPPPPSGGGIVLVEMLQMLETFDLRGKGSADPETRHLILETMRRCFLDRARYLGDQDFVPIPAFLTSKPYAADMARQIDPRRASPSETLAPDIVLAPEETSTTHFSVVDADGMAVANTYTLEQSYGARVMVRGRGFLLNNEMGDFNWVPNRTDRQGRIGTPPNLIAPGKRMLSSQTPVLVLKEGRPYLITGSPGGRTIINTVLCVVLNVLEFQLDLPSAVAAPRWHHQWLPDKVKFEAVQDPAYQSLVDTLGVMGHTIDPASEAQGDAHSILIDPVSGTVIGVADRRINDQAVAVPSTTGLENMPGRKALEASPAAGR